MFFFSLFTFGVIIIGTPNTSKGNQASVGDKYELRTVIVPNGYYGSCERCTTNTNTNLHQRKYAADSETVPLLGQLRPIRLPTSINIRIFSLGVLFIGGISIGSYLLYVQGMHNYDLIR